MHEEENTYISNFIYIGIFADNVRRAYHVHGFGEQTDASVYEGYKSRNQSG